jgi:hypothetical protein
MQSLPENVISVEKEEERIFGLDSQGSRVMEYSLESGEWVEIETGPLTPDNLRSGKWGEFTFVAQDDGSYNMKDRLGVIIPDFVLYEDWTVVVAGQKVAMQAVNNKDGLLNAGPRTLEAGKWSEPKMMSVEEARSFLENGKLAEIPNKLVILRNPDLEKASETDLALEQATLETMRVERDAVMTQEKLKAVWDGKQDTLNRVTYMANADPAEDTETVKAYEVGEEWSKAIVKNRNFDVGMGKGTASGDGRYGVTFLRRDGQDINSMLFELRPMEWVWGDGMFVMQVATKNKDGSYDLSAPAVHVSVALAKSKDEYVCGSNGADLDPNVLYSLVTGEEIPEIISIAK